MRPKKAFYGTLRLLTFLVMFATAYLISLDFVFAIPVRIIFWLVMIPVMVMIIYFVPGFWRNICPLATTHLLYFNLFHKKKLEFKGKQVNELSGWRGKAHDFLTKRGVLISALLFWLIVPARLFAFYDSNIYTLYILAFIFGTALIMGILFPVKSGWCTSICPVFAVEKTYSINPALYVRNTRCDYTSIKDLKVKPCSGCSFNCMDIVGPEKSYMMEGYNKVFHDTINAKMRSLFIATLPGFLAGYFFLTRGIEEVAPQFISFLFEFRDSFWNNGAYALKVYLFEAIFMILSLLLYTFMKSFIQRHVKKKEGKLDISHPSKLYALSKRRLDLIFMTFAINIFWAGFSYGIIFMFLGVLTGMSAASLLYMNLVAVLFVLLLTVYGLSRGWNETLQNSHRSW